MRILYDSKNSIYKKPYGCIKEGEKCSISIHIPQDCLTNRVFLCFEGEKEFKFELFKSYATDGYDIFTVDFDLNSRGLYFYYFYIETQNTSFGLYRYGFSDTNIEEGEKWQLTCLPRDFEVCDKWKGRVMYQIFPDRFHKEGECDLSEKLTPFTVHQNTKDIPCYLPDETGEILNNDFFGGNLKGIEKKLPYLKDLGVSVIYLNPIFQAFSNHRYDTCDYKTIDPMLGTEADFKSLCDEAHKLGIKIILDGVFSHTGSDSIYFDEKHRFGTGVLSNENSSYKTWFTLKEDGTYDSWWGIKTLPCVNELSEDFVNYIIKDDDSVIKHWLRLGADGFRLDVADELPDEFIRMLRREVKSINPNAIVLGEVWEDASNKIAYNVRRRYFTDAELDSVMNYPFRDAIIELVCGNINTREFSQRILTITENYPKDVVDCFMNSLSTHDTPRIMNVLSGAPTDLDRYKAAQYEISPEERATATGRIFLAVMLQFFLPGNPCIYYGDEIGMWGFGDPFNRGYFDWDNRENDMHTFHKSIADIKNQYPELKTGTIHFLKTDGNSMIIERRGKEKSLFAAVNLSDDILNVQANECICSNNCNHIDNNYEVYKYGFLIYR